MKNSPACAVKSRTIATTVEVAYPNRAATCSAVASSTKYARSAS